MLTRFASLGFLDAEEEIDDSVVRMTMIVGVWMRLTEVRVPSEAMSVCEVAPSRFEHQLRQKVVALVDDESRRLECRAAPVQN